MDSDGASPLVESEILQIKIKEEEPDSEDHQNPMKSSAAPLTDGGYLQTVPKREVETEESDNKDHLASVKREMDSLAASPLAESEVLQIKEEEPNPEDHVTPIEVLEVKIAEEDDYSSDTETPNISPASDVTYGNNELDQVKNPPHSSGILRQPKQRKSLTNPEFVSGPRYETRAASSNSQDFICNTCGKGFSASQDLLTHVCARISYETLRNKATNLQRESNSNYDVTPTGEFRCRECDKSFSYKMGVINHARVHTGEKPFPCSECGKCFTLKCNLQKHLKIHSGEKPFTCLECGKSFTQKVGLQVHQNMHAGVKPFTCTECGKSFPKKSTLLRHGKSHTVERTCMRCSKSVTQKRSHDDQAEEKPFTCTECEKKINYMKQLPYKCTECGDSFFHNSHLVIHRRVHEREKLFKCKRVRGDVL
ncbi:hypothetical protein XELAEV_18030454mg [Xenopus laevis]|uniref:C2H2-type domain-containing protein n=1 Tax=Xenopus laevis TaxID=8355 RepID=A0A974CMC4_XENLA|nr:hypothetical protein XELAEV_18030454mg [Xenopus laevis]